MKGKDVEGWVAMYTNPEICWVSNLSTWRMGTSSLSWADHPLEEEIGREIDTFWFGLARGEVFSFIGNSLGGVAVNQTLGAHVGKAEMFLVWGCTPWVDLSGLYSLRDYGGCFLVCIKSFSKSLFVSSSNSRDSMGKAGEGLAVAGGLNSLPPGWLHPFRGSGHPGRTQRGEGSLDRPISSNHSNAKNKWLSILDSA